ncbi:hypothetical protein S83_015336, partial [Arachis hypogaea]
IIIREEKEARNVVEKVCKEKSVELKQIQDKKSAAERLGYLIPGDSLIANLYHDMYKGLNEYNMNLQRYNSLLTSDLEAANEVQRKLETEMASNFGGSSSRCCFYNKIMLGVIRRRVASSSPYPMCGNSTPALQLLLEFPPLLKRRTLWKCPELLSHDTWVLGQFKIYEVFCQEATMQTWRRPFSSDSGDNVDVVVPPLAESIADRTLAKFLKRPGDSVAVDEPIVQIEKDKVIWGNMQIFINDFVPMTHPMAVTNCNIEMESLISDQNISIATLAITTLLKTGNESSVDHLMKQITNFMFDIADEFKIVVVEAIISLCLKFPLKYRSL